MRKLVAILLTFALLMSVMKLTGGSLVLAETRSGIVINEVMAANSKTIRDGDIDDKKEGSKGGAYSDWIELYNMSDEPIDLTGYILCDSKATWTFPEVTVEAKGYLLVWASDKNKVAKDGQLHTNFKLSASGDVVVLKSPDGIIIDSVTFEGLDDDQSYGRKTDGADEFEIFAKSTPLESNANGRVFVKPPLFSKEGGFYTNEFELSVTSEVYGAKIYYTTNGSDPVPGEKGTLLYDGPIKIKSRAGEENVLSMIKEVSDSWSAPKGEVFKCTTLKAVAVREDGEKSKIITHTYFVDPDIKTRYTLPVISVVTDYDNLFDPSNGIYTANNASKKGDEWERPVHIEYFDTNGKLGFSQNIGLRIHGNASRGLPQKSLRIYADGENGDLGKIKYEVFPGLTKTGSGKSLKTFERLILRNCGNDWNIAHMRDELTHTLVSHISGLDTQAVRPAILFLNGEYWGIYYIRERYDKDYFKNHYDLDNDKVAILEFSKKEEPEIQEGTSEDAEAYKKDVIDYLKSNSITDTKTYEYIKTKIDVDNFIIYYITQIFCGNTDWQANNTVIWKYKTEDGKYNPEASYGMDGRWRWVLKDTDLGFGYHNDFSVTRDSLSDAIGDTRNPRWYNFLFQTLLKNTEFRNQFINCFADQLNTTFNSERVLQVIKEFEDTLSPEMLEHSNRWQTRKLIDENIEDSTWSRNVQVIKDYAKRRPEYIIGFIENKFRNEGVTGTAKINLKTDSKKGFIKINSIDIKSSTPGVKDPNEWEGIYFTGIPVKLKAIANDGYVFDHWEGISGDSDTIEFIHDKPITVTAVFKQVSAAIPEETTPTPAATPTPVVKETSEPIRTSTKTSNSQSASTSKGRGGGGSPKATSTTPVPIPTVTDATITETQDIISFSTLITAEDFNEARSKVAKLPISEEKTRLMSEINNRQAVSVIESVIIALKGSREDSETKAIEIINSLPSEVIGSNTVKSISNTLSYLTNAEVFINQYFITKAQEYVNSLDESPIKTALIERLEMVKSERANKPLIKTENVEVIVGREKLIFDQNPVIEGGRVLVPFRAIAESLGADVMWIGETQTVTAKKDDIEIIMNIGKNIAYVNGVAINLDVAPKILNGRTLLPLRFFAESFGVEVIWDGTTNTVIVDDVQK